MPDTLPQASAMLEPKADLMLAMTGIDKSYFKDASLSSLSAQLSGSTWACAWQVTCDRLSSRCSRNDRRLQYDRRSVCTAQHLRSDDR